MNSILIPMLVNDISQFVTSGLDLPSLVTYGINQPTSQSSQELATLKQQGQLPAIQQDVLQHQQALLPFEVVGARGCVG